MRKLLAILLLLVFLAGGGAAAWWFMLRGEGAATAEGEAAPAQKPVYVDMAQMVVPVIRSDGSVRTFIFELSLELPRDDAVKPVTDMMPRLYDTVLVTLHELLGRRFVEEGGYDQELIKSHLARVVRQAAGQDQVNAVLIRTMERYGRG